jgi:hypothetical protein
MFRISKRLDRDGNPFAKVKRGRVVFRLGSGDSTEEWKPGIWLYVQQTV